MRKALIVGIDHYHRLEALTGCVNGAHLVRAVLDRHSDGSVNFESLLLTSSSEDDAIDSKTLRQRVKNLFKDDVDIALFYFAGHGHVAATGGFLVTSESEEGEDGLPLNAVLKLANDSPARNKVIVLDCNHSGSAGNLDASARAVGMLSEGLTILTATSDEQAATRNHGASVFTELFVDALHGAAANLVGAITPGSIYAHIDQSLGPWAQRPLFKTNVKTFVSLRNVDPPIDLADLRRITDFFPTRGHHFALDPTFEPERTGSEPDDIPPPTPENTRTFAILQKYNRVNLLVPEGAPHMWHAAMQSKKCKLTVLGEHYRSLVARNRL